MTAAPAAIDPYRAPRRKAPRPGMQDARRSVHTVVPDVGETISYAMPTFTLDGRPLLHVAAWKKHIGVYPLPAMANDRARAVEPYRGAKDTFRLPLDAVPYELFERV